jgi:hypothetical protein
MNARGSPVMLSAVPLTDSAPPPQITATPIITLARRIAKTLRARRSRVNRRETIKPAGFGTSALDGA